MKHILCLLVFFIFLGDSVFGQTKKHTTEKKVGKIAEKKFEDKDTGFELAYPDSFNLGVFRNNEDIKVQVDPFTIEIYKEQEAPFKKDGKPVIIAMDPIADDCYQFIKVQTSKYHVELKEFLCTEGAAGTIYYSFIYEIEKEHYAILLKFVHKHCNSCTDGHGKAKEFDEEKDTRWIKEIIESANFLNK